MFCFDFANGRLLCGLNLKHISFLIEKTHFVFHNHYNLFCDFYISAEYYRYLKVLQDKDTDSVSNLLIDGGLAEPIRVFSNIDGGVGILGSCHVGMFETEIASSSHSNLEAARFEDGID